MKIAVLGSSSSGNSTYVEIGDVKFLIDVGLGFNDIKDKLFHLGVTADEINFILITHAHNDHVKCLHSFSRVYDTKIYIGKETLEEYQKKDLIHNYEFIENIDNIMGINIKRIPISHDKKGFGYVIEKDGITLIYITDTGMIHSRYHEMMSNKDIYLLESNHDVEMEMTGSKDYMTKIRNTGDMGHLSNDDCARYLNRFVGRKTKAIMLMHISEHDNTPDLTFTTNRAVISDRIPIYLSNIIEI